MRLSLWGIAPRSACTTCLRSERALALAARRAAARRRASGDRTPAAIAARGSELRESARRRARAPASARSGAPDRSPQRRPVRRAAARRESAGSAAAPARAHRAMHRSSSCLRGRRGARAAVDGQAALVEPHLEAIAEADERIARQPLAALDALQQEARLERLELEIGRHRRVQVGGNVERRFQAAVPRRATSLREVRARGDKKPISGFALGDGFLDSSSYVTCSSCDPAALSFREAPPPWPGFARSLRHGGEYYRPSLRESNSHNFPAADARPLCHRRLD